MNIIFKNFIWFRARHKDIPNHEYVLSPTLVRCRYPISIVEPGSNIHKKYTNEMNKSWLVALRVGVQICNSEC